WTVRWRGGKARQRAVLSSTDCSQRSPPPACRSLSLSQSPIAPWRRCFSCSVWWCARLVGKTEIFVALALACLFPGWFSVVAYGLGILCFVSAGLRLADVLVQRT